MKEEKWIYGLKYKLEKIKKNKKERRLQEKINLYQNIGKNDTDKEVYKEIFALQTIRNRYQVASMAIIIRPVQIETTINVT